MYNGNLATYSGWYAIKPNQLILDWVAQLAGAVEYTNCISAQRYDSLNKCPRYGSNILMGNAEYPFIAIAPRSTLAQSSSTW